MSSNFCATIAADEFKRMATLLGSLTKPNATILQYQNVFFTLGNGSNKLECVAADGESTVRMNILTQSLESNEADSCAFSLPGHDLAKISRSIDAKTVKVYGDGRIHAGKSKFKLPQFTENLMFPVVDGECFSDVTIPAGVVRNLYASTAHAMAKNDARTFLNGMHVVWGENQFEWTGTNGHRLAQYRYESSNTNNENWDVIISNEGMNTLLKMLKGAGVDDEFPVVFTLSKRGTLSVDVPAAELYMRFLLIDGKYPDVRKVIPAKHDRPIYFNANHAHIEKAIKDAILLADNQSNAIILERPGNTDDVMQIKSYFNGKETTCVVEGEWHGFAGPEPFSIAANGQYLLEAIAVDGKDVSLHFDTPEKSIATFGENGVQVVMPVRV